MLRLPFLELEATLNFTFRKSGINLYRKLGEFVDMEKALLTISIVHFNTAEMTKRCIESIFNVLDSGPLSGLYEISIVDNRSDILEYENLSYFVESIGRENVFLQRSCMNTGFGLGCMLTLNRSARENIAFVNSDTFFDEDCFTPLIKFLKGHPKAAAITPQHKDGGGNPTRSFSRFDSFGSRFIGSWVSRPFIADKKNPNNLNGNVTTVDFIFGSFMMVKRDAFAIVGGFDPSIFLYYEEMDLCLRLKKCGFSTHFYPNASFRHIGNGSSSGVTEVLRLESLLSMIYVMRKHRGAVYGLAFYLALVFQSALKAPFKSRNRRIFIGVLKAFMPQACSHRLTQSCNFEITSGIPPNQ